MILNISFDSQATDADPATTKIDGEKKVSRGNGVHYEYSLREFVDRSWTRCTYHC